MLFASAAPGEANRVPKKQTLTADVGELPNKLPKEKLELTSKRTANSTRYLNPDGSFTEEIYMEPKFYKDPADKKWKKIDNTLKKSTKKQGKFENTANETKAWIASEAGSGELATIEKDGKSVSFVPAKANKVQGTIKDNEITYKGILENVDFRYRVQGRAVKEDIILNQYQNEHTFRFGLNLKGVTVQKEKNGMIVFKDSKGKNIWYFEQPYMTDAKGKYSENVTLNLLEENGKTYVEVVADEAFLTDVDTQYPVTIDPTIDNWDVIRDMFIASNFPDSVYSSETFMNTGFHGYFGTTRAFLKFYLPSLPSSSVIESATFNAYQTKNDSQQVAVDLYRVTSDWQTATTKWNSQPATASTKESTVTSTSFNSYWSWDITQLSKDWYNGVQPNYGVMLKQQNEATSPYRTFTSVNNGMNTPRLTINYRVEAIGLESFWINTEDGVNPANGNLVFQESDFEIPGLGPIVNLTRTFNSRKSSIKGLFGYGWFSNVEMNLVDSGDGPIMFFDGDKTHHIFGQEIGGGYKAAGGVYLDLVKNADGTYTITETDGTITNFQTNGKISSIIDTNGNTVTFVYDTAGKLTKIQDASGRETLVSYGTNGYISSVTDPAGHVTRYEYDASGNLIKVTDQESKITTFSYDADHNITGITDARSIKTTIDYDTSDRVKNISRPITINGIIETSQTTYAYDTANLVTTVTDGEGKRIDYTMNPNGNVAQIAENPLDAATKAVTTFTYDNKNNLTKVVDANTNKKNGTAAYIYTYDTNGNITGVQLPENQKATFEYDSDNNLIKEQDYNQNVSSNDYDKNNNHTESTDPSVQTSASRYDAKGNLLYSTHPMSAADNLLANSGFEIDNSGDNWPVNWEQLKDDGSTANFAWSSTSKFGGKAVSISNPTSWALVRSDKFDYTAGEKYIASAYVKTDNTTGTALLKFEFFDDLNNRKGEAVYSSEIKGTNDWTRLQAVIDSVPEGTTKITVAVGMNAGAGTAYFDGVQLEKGTTLSAYNLVENSSLEKDTNQDGIPDNWDTSGNLSANDKTVQNVNPEDDNVYIGSSSFQMTGEAGKNKYTKQRINISGDANTPFTLSGWGKQVGADPNGGSFEMQVVVNYTEGPKGTNFGNNFDKNAQGWQHLAAFVKPTDAFDSIDVYYHYNNQSGTAWFDAARLEIGTSIASNEYDTGGNYVTSIKDQLGNTVFFGYDEVGNRTSIKDAKGQIISFTYDSRNLLTKVTDAKQGVTSYGYDGNGNRTTVTDAKGNVTKYDYNEFNLVSKITNPLNQVIQFEYDRNGNQTKLVYPKGDAISSSFDALNRLNGTYVNGVKKWGYGYDANGNLTSVTDASGSTKTFVYDDNNRITKESQGSTTTDYGYDSNSNLTSVKFTAGAASVSTEIAYNKLDQLITLSRNGVNVVKFVYDERGNVTSAKRANNTYAALNYNDANQLNELKNYKNDGSVLNSYNYSYDPNGNQTSIATNKGTVSYEYDSLNQLTKETLTDGTVITYEYDAPGNRTKKVETKGSTSTTTNYTYNVGNELTNVNGQVFTYDQNGNLINDGEKTYIYNEENQLIEVKDKTGTSLARFTYDQEGKRTSMTTSAGTTNFHYSGDKVIAETDTNNNIIAEYSWDDQGNPVTMTRGGKIYYYHLNGHGDVTALTDENGNVVAEYQYDAWGNIISQTGTMASTNPNRYAGYRYDETTKLYYLMARYYDSNLGRFITRDTFHGFQEDPQSLNQYIYTKNNPVINFDPDGHMSFKNIKTSYGYRNELWLNNTETKWLEKGLIAAGWVVNGVTAVASKLGLPTQVLIAIAVAAGSYKVTSMADYVKKKNKGSGVIINYGKYYDSRKSSLAAADKTPIVRAR